MPAVPRHHAPPNERSHMTPLERLRLATALTHTVPGAAMHLRCNAGDELTVSGHPAADLDPCAMRSLVIATMSGEATDYSERIDRITVAGSLQHLGGGVHRRVYGAMEQRWIATLLPPDAVGELLDDCRVGELPPAGMKGCVKPDPSLGITCIAITSNNATFDTFLDEVAAQAMATLMVAELLCAEHPVGR